jgi:hypothetical protein
MDIAGVHIPAAIAAGGTFGAVYSAFVRADRIQSRNNRRFVGRWLLRLAVPGPEWGTFFRELLANFFGPKHLSLKLKLDTNIPEAIE